MFPMAGLLARRDYRGTEKLVRGGPMLVVGNHISHLDPVFDATMIRRAGRLPHILAKASLWKLPVVGNVMRGTQQIPVDRGGGAGQASLTAATRSLADGQVLLIYPEGTITRDPDRWPMRPRPGVAALALSGDFPVVPIAHWGTHQVYDSYAPTRKFRPWPRKTVTIAIGDPVDLDDLRARPHDARSIRDASLRIMTAVRELLEEVRQEEAPSAFYDPKKAGRPPAGPVARG
ncbi:lysophospholipid acyltransferase family protein [Nakamurella flavida]